MSHAVVLYLPIGRKTFDLEAGETYRKQSMNWLEESGHTIVAPNDILTSVEELEQFLQTNASSEIDTILYQSVTFADGEFMVKTLEYFREPVIVWSVREPSVGGRL